MRWHLLLMRRSYSIINIHHQVSHMLQSGPLAGCLCINGEKNSVFTVISLTVSIITHILCHIFCSYISDVIAALC